MKIQCRQCYQFIKAGTGDSANLSCPHCGADLNDAIVHETGLDRFWERVQPLMDHFDHPHYYVKADGDEEDRGPYDYDSLELMWRRQDLKATDHVRFLGKADWVEVAQVAPKFDRIRRKKVILKITLTLAVITGIVAWACSGIIDVWFESREYKKSVALHGAPKEETFLVVTAATSLVVAILSGSVAAVAFLDVFSTKREIGR